MKRATYLLALLVGFLPIGACSTRRAPLDRRSVTANDRIAQLENAFRNAANDDDRALIARQLIEMDVPNDTPYWAVLETRGRRVAPHATRITSRGPMGTNSATANTRDTTASSAASSPAGNHDTPDVYAADVDAIVDLAMVGDKRARPILRDALQSRDLLVSAEAAMGLAKLKDYESISAIYNAAFGFRKDRDLFGRALLFFGRPDANRLAADLFTSAASFNAWRARARVTNYDPFPAAE